jgi:hypothetical protein
MEPLVTQTQVGNIHNIMKTDLLAVSNLVRKHVGVEVFWKEYITYKNCGNTLGCIDLSSMRNIQRQRVVANSSEQWYGIACPGNACTESKETAPTKRDSIEKTHYDG